MAETLRERRAAGNKAEQAAAVLEAIARMPPEDREMAEAIHAIVEAVAPQLSPRTWYGMPAYTLNDNVVCFFQGGYKFKARYATLGFSDRALLDDGMMWPNAYALTQIGPAEEAMIAALVKRAVEGG